MFKSFLNNNTLLKIVSVIIAFSVWLVMVENVDRESYATFREVNIDMSNVEDSISTLGLNSIRPDVEVASVNVSGIMYAVGNLDKDDIKIVPDISKVTGAGVYELPLVATVKDGIEDVQVTSVSPSRITVRFDTLHSKVLDINSNLNGIKGEIGYLIQDELVNPAQVTITGPEAEVSRISSCEIRTTIDEKLSETYSKKDSLVLLDKNGNEITSENISMDVTEATVTIPVLKIRDIPVELQFMNVPKNFPIDNLEFTLSSNSVSVAGVQASIDKYSSILLDHIDFKKLGLGSSYAFSVNLPTGFWNVENVQSVQVSLNDDDLARKKINLENINIVNVPLGYNARALSQQLTDVEFIGEVDDLMTLSADDVIAEVDMNQNSEIEVGQVLMPVKIYVPNGSCVWAKGSYEVVVFISTGSEEEEILSEETELSDGEEVQEEQTQETQQQTAQ